MAFRSANALMAAEYAGEEQAMQKEQQKFMEEQAKAQGKAEKKAQKSSLWSGLGGTLGGLAAGAITLGSGGILGPAALAALMTYGGSKAGSSASDGQLFRDKQVKMKQMPVSTGKFMSGKRQAFESQKKAEVDALKDYQDSAAKLLSEGQLTGALTSGVTAGVGQLESIKKLEEASRLAEIAKGTAKVGSKVIPLVEQFKNYGGGLQSSNYNFAPQDDFSYTPTAFGYDE